MSEKKDNSKGKPQGGHIKTGSVKPPSLIKKAAQPPKTIKPPTKK